MNHEINAGRLGEEHGELFEDDLDHLSDAIEGHADGLVVSNWPTRAERYANGWEEIHVRILTAEAGHFCAIFNAATGNCPSGAPGDTGAEEPALSASGEQVEVSVLIDDGKLLDPLQPLDAVRIRSETRLELLDGCHCLRVHPIQTLPGLEGICPPIRMGGDGESIPPVGGAVVLQHQLPDKIIERCPEVGEEVPRDEAQRVRRLLGDTVDVPDFLRRIRVELTPNGNRVSILEGLNCRLQGVQVVPCPVEFGLNIGERSVTHELRELRGERFDDARNLVRDALKRRNHWKTLDGLASVAENYARGDLDVHLHLRFYNFPRPEINCSDRVIGYGKIARPADLCVRAKRHPSIEVSSTSETGKGHAGGQGTENREQAVFVGIVQLLKAKQAAMPTPVPSLVWLKRLDACPEFSRDAPKDTSAISTILAPETTRDAPARSPDADAANRVDRKGGSVEGIIGFSKSKLPRQPIESGSQVVGNFANQQRPIDGEVFRPTLDSQTVMVGLRVVLGYADFVEVVPEEPLKAFLKSYDLAVGPLDPLTWPEEWMHDVQSGYGERDTEDPTGRGDTSPQAQGLRRGAGRRGDADQEATDQEAVTGSPPEQVAPRTDRSRRSGGYKRRLEAGGEQKRA